MESNKNKIEKLISELCPKGVEFLDVGKLLIKAPKSKLGVAQVKELGDGDNICFTSGKSIFYVNDYLVDGEYIFMNDGGAADVKFNKGKAYYTDHTFTFTFNKTKVLPKFVYFILKENEKYINDILFKGTGLKNLNKKEFEKFKIPLPPLAIQKEIVKILDSFTELEVELEAELEAELETRKKQYEYYRDKMFHFGNKVQYIPLDSFCKIGDGLHGTPKYIPNGEYYFINGNNLKKGKLVFEENTKTVDEGMFNKYGIELSIGKTILMSINGTIGSVAFFRNEKVVLGKSVAYLNLKYPELNLRFLYYLLQTTFAKKYFETQKTGSTIKNLGLKALREFKIPVPTLKEQERIVSILDKFDALVNDISIGLPAELKARRQQYEYYREKLLTFNELEK